MLSTTRTDALKRLAQAAAGASSGAIVYALLQSVTLIVVTRAGGQADAATFFLAQAVATPLAQLAGLRMKEQLAVEGELTSFKQRLLRLTSVSLVVMLFASAGWLLVADNDRAWVGIAILAANLSQSVVFAYQGRAARRSEFFVASQADSLLGLLSFLCIGAGYLFADSLLAGATAMAIGWTLVATGIAGIELRRFSDGTDQLPSVASDVANGASAMATLGQISLARIGTEVFAGSAALAALGTASFLVRTGSIIVMGARSAMGPMISKAKAGNRLDSLCKPMVIRIHVTVVATTGIAAWAGWTVARPAIRLVFGEEVLPDRLTAALVLGSAPLLYGSMILAQLAVARERSTALLQANILSLAATLVTVTALGVPYGAVGGAWALGVGFLVRYLAIARVVVSARPFNRVIAMTAVAVSIAAFAFFSFVGHAVIGDHENLADDPSDVIVVLSGGKGERLERAMDLAEDAPPQVLILMLPEDWQNPAAMLVRERCEVDDERFDIICIPPDPDNTAGEARTAIAIAKARGLEAITVVTSDFHVSRGERWFARCGVQANTASATSTRSRDRLRREWYATVDSLVFQRECPREASS